MSEVYEVDGELFATEALAQEAISRISKRWGSAVGYSRPKTSRRRQVHTSIEGLLNWSGRYGKYAGE